MDETAVIGAIVGGFIGYIVSYGIASPRFTYLGGGWFKSEGGMGCFTGCLLQIVLIAVGAAIGLGVGLVLSA